MVAKNSSFILVNVFGIQVLSGQVKSAQGWGVKV
jgi:hypothetical protein